VASWSVLSFFLEQEARMAITPHTAIALAGTFFIIILLWFCNANVKRQFIIGNDRAHKIADEMLMYPKPILPCLISTHQ
jgi:hypothetical protein